MAMNITISGAAVAIPELAKVGQPVDAIFASYINRTYRDIIRDAVLASIAKLPEGSPAPDVQKVVNETVKTFKVEELSLTSNRLTDPVEKTAVEMAEAFIRTVARTEGKTLPKPADLREMARTLVAKQPTWLEKAKKRVAEAEVEAKAGKASVLGMLGKSDA